jgi:hypothetical protein
MKIKSIHILLAITIIIGGGILLASELDLYNTTRIKSPRKTVEGVYDISGTRGSHTLEEIEKYYKLPPSSVIEAFGLRPDTDPKYFQLKDMKEIFAPVELEEEEYIVETDTVKVFTSLYLKIPYVSDETFYLPEKTVNYLIENDKLTGEEKEYWQGHTFKLEYLDSKYLTASEFFKVVVEEAEEFKVTGSTTIQELLDYGITEEKFEEVTGFKVPDKKSGSVRDFVIDKGVEFGEVKDKFIE